MIFIKHLTRLPANLLLVTFWITGNAFSSLAQPAEIEWLPVVKTAKDQHTLALLNAGPGGFQLLRWQERRTDASGNITPAMPLLTLLTPGGERLYDEPLPGFADGTSVFRFAVANDSVLFVVYETPGGEGQTLFARRLNMGTKKWSAPAVAVFTDPSNHAPAFATAWFSRSGDGGHCCIYRSQRLASGAQKVSVAVFDAAFGLKWKHVVELPAQSGPSALQSVLCTNSGAVVLHARLFGSGAIPQTAFPDEPPTIYRPDGRAMFHKYDAAADLPAYANALFVLTPRDTKMTAFYPKLGKKFTRSFQLTEGAGELVYCTGFSSDENNTQADAYFVYQIDLKTPEGHLLQNAPLPAAVRKAFLSEKAAAKKEPVEGLALRWLNWGEDGKPWLLAERENFGQPPGRIEESALLRLDSTFRITAARKIEKYQRLSGGDAQNFASMAACTGPKGAWWLLWNDGSWPDTKLILSECRPSGNPVDHQLGLSSRSNVALLPQTILRSNAAWYFVGESEYHERIRIGRLKVKM